MAGLFMAEKQVTSEKRIVYQSDCDVVRKLNETKTKCLPAIRSQQLLIENERGNRVLIFIMVWNIVWPATQSGDACWPYQPGQFSDFQ